ncbi:hypothetical protein J6TS2_21600 [Heyndrickxia sporothermodurans]|nr:hypothetical protein J6TS2_21600 [Heyndrickxia sporothermodurans]
MLQQKKAFQVVGLIRKKQFNINSKPTYHIVKKGKVLSKISMQYKTSVSEIMKLNKNIKDKDLIYPNQKN